jgi:exopolysaccharide biosynthesis polyprenyl glycosylphosphotransferase
MNSHELADADRYAGDIGRLRSAERFPVINRRGGLVIGDAIVVFLAICGAYIFRIGFYEGNPIEALFLVERLTLLAPAAVAAHLVFFYIFELYDPAMPREVNLKTVIWITLAVIGATSVIVLLVFLFPHHGMGRVLLATHIPLTIALISAWRWVFVKSLPEQYFKKNLVWCDFGGIDRPILSEVAGKAAGDYRWVGTVSPGGDNRQAVRLNAEEVYPSLPHLLARQDIHTVVLSENPKEPSELKASLIDCKFKGIEMYDFPTFYGKLFGKVPVRNIRGSYFLLSHQNRSFQPFLYLRLKRLFDAGAAAAGLLIASPLLIGCAMAIKLTSKGPVFFTQERLGMNEHPFTLIKFRTMVADAEKGCGPQWSCKGDPRITPVGAFLRKTRLDEIPQLINVLKGEMSLVGPRPIRRHFADLLAKEFPFYRLRFSVKPGLTGWAQVKGDYAGSVEGQLEKLEYELFYIQNRSFFMDLFIILKTVQTVLFRPGE